MAELNQIRVHTFVERQLDILAGAIEKKLDADVMAIVGPIYPPLDDAVRQAIESRMGKINIEIVVQTDGVCVK